MDALFPGEPTNAKPSCCHELYIACKIKIACLAGATSDGALLCGIAELRVSPMCEPLGACRCHGSEDETENEADAERRRRGVVVGTIGTLEGAADLADVQGEETARRVQRTLEDSCTENTLVRATGIILLVNQVNQCDSFYVMRPDRQTQMHYPRTTLGEHG